MNSSNYETMQEEGRDAKTKDETLTIVTYNIAGNHDSFWKKEGHLDRLVGSLKRLNADVICLQEVSGFDGTNPHNTQAHAIASRLRMNCIFKDTTTIRGRLYGNAILSRFPIHSFTFLHLPHGSLKRDTGERMPGATEPRIAISAIVSPFPSYSERDFLIICTHLAKYNTEDTHNGTALAPCNILNKFINDGGDVVDVVVPASACEKKSVAAMPALLAGDLNCLPESPIWKSLKEEGGWRMHESLPTRLDRKIDYICDRGMGMYRMENPQALRDIDTSDHFPLLARWHLDTQQKKNLSSSAL